MNYYFVTFKVTDIAHTEGNFISEGDFKFVKEAENLKEKHGLVEIPYISGIFPISESMYLKNKQ